jgi:hypothetical protein
MALATAIEFSPHFAHLERDKLQVLASRSVKSSLLIVFPSTSQCEISFSRTLNMFQMSMYAVHSVIDGLSTVAWWNLL